MHTLIRATSGFADDGRPLVVTFPEEVDFETVSSAREELLVLINRGARNLILDLSDTRFCDSAGVNAVFRAHHRARLAGARLRLVAPDSSPVRRVFDLIRMGRVIPVLPSVVAAREDLTKEENHADHIPQELPDTSRRPAQHQPPLGVHHHRRP
jgi:anti-sigma B factor antagonist